MGDLPRRSFLGFLAALPFVGKLIPAEKPVRALRVASVVNHSELPKPQKLTALMFNTECYIADRGEWLRRIIRIDKLFHVTMPCCGYQVSYPTLESLPQKTVPCPCGRKDYNVVQWPEDPVCKRCEGRKVVCVVRHEPVTDPGVMPCITRRSTVQIPCPTCQVYNTVQEDDGRPIEMHWDTKNNDLYTRPKGSGFEDWKKIGVS